MKNEIAAPFGLAMTTHGVKIVNASVIVNPTCHLLTFWLGCYHTPLGRSSSTARAKEDLNTVFPLTKYMIQPIYLLRIIVQNIRIRRSISSILRLNEGEREMKNCDVIVIGSGVGLSIVFKALSANSRVTLVVRPFKAFYSRGGAPGLLCKQP
jgi:hypothetical protein